jgi:serpin B
LENGGGDVVLRMGNALWVDVSRRLLDSFLTQVEPYDTTAQNVDFAQSEAARRHINSWVEEKTENKIKELIPTGILDSTTKLVITNAIYFKGAWETPFEAEVTWTSNFNLLGNSGVVQVPMMKAAKTVFLYKDQSDHVVVGLPYKGNQTAMFILLPKENSATALQKGSSEEVLLATMSQLSQIGKTKINLSLPRFKATCSTRLKQILIDMGMVLPFADNADFGGMNAEGDLKIAEVLHKAFVEVNEVGTEAAAATAAAMALRGRGSPIPVVTVDHPFVFMIAHIQSQSILFSGRIVDPSKEGED